jgi:ABC-type Na+ efflux pump permease subunit
MCRSVIEEKQLFLPVKPFQLMIGKIIGTSLAGMQFFIWAVIASLDVCCFGIFGVNAGPTAKVPPN